MGNGGGRAVWQDPHAERARRKRAAVPRNSRCGKDTGFGREEVIEGPPPPPRALSPPFAHLRLPRSAKEAVL